MFPYVWPSNLELVQIVGELDKPRAVDKLVEMHKEHAKEDKSGSMTDEGARSYFEKWYDLNVAKV